MEEVWCRRCSRPLLTLLFCHSGFRSCHRAGGQRTYMASLQEWQTQVAPPRHTSTRFLSRRRRSTSATHPVVSPRAPPLMPPIDLSLSSSFLHTAIDLPNFSRPPPLQGREADLWALGCCVYQFLAGFTPFHAPSPYLCFLRIKKGVFRYCLCRLSLTGPLRPELHQCILSHPPSFYPTPIHSKPTEGFPSSSRARPKMHACLLDPR